MLQISIYYSGSHEQRTEVEGAHGRLAHHDGTFDAERILMAEVNGDYDRYIDGEKQRWTGQERGDILVAGICLTHSTIGRYVTDHGSLCARSAKGRYAHFGGGRPRSGGTIFGARVPASVLSLFPHRIR